MVITILWWTIRVSVTMDTKRTPVRHLVVLTMILVLVVLAYVYVANAPTPTRIQPVTQTVISRKSHDKGALAMRTASGEDDSTDLAGDASHSAKYHKPTTAASAEVLHESESGLQTTVTRRERCAKCFQPRITPIIAARYLCRPTEIAGNVDIITLIFSQVSHLSRREAIRQTWVSPTKQNTAILRHIFVLGFSHNPDDNSAVQLENKKFLDILQFDFIDSYANLTLKTLGALSWATKHCPAAKHVVKTDEDVWFNLQRLLWVLPRYDLVKAIGGYCVKNAKPDRNPKSKWYVSYETYPSNTYPPFCSGTGYVLRMQTAKDIVRISPNVPFYRLEDVYVGLCLEQLGYRIQSLPGFHNTFVHFDPCTYRKTVVTSHDVSEDLLHWAWNSDCVVHPYVIENT